MDYVERNGPLPRWLEVGINCEKLNIHPGQLGFDVSDPRVLTNIRIAMNVYETAISRKYAPKKSEWDTQNPDGARLLKWARGGESKLKADPREATFTIMEKPKSV